MDENLVTPVEPDPFAEQERRFWGQVGEELAKNSIRSLDGIARQIIVVSGILEGLYFHAIAYSGLRGAVSGWALLVYAAPVALLLVSLGAALLVFYPDRYRIDLRSWRAARLVHQRVVTSKYWLVVAASVTLLLGVAFILAALLLYLMGG